ncbi:MAG: helix-turn-helix domain-containing protein [Butyricicoccus sp.]|nr:helix-turn-helix domain-containing protein [Butyricicoccus sp.]
MSHFRILRNIPPELGCISQLTSMRAGHTTVLHWHDYLEFELVLSGSGEHRLEGRSYEFAPGDCWLIGSTDSHSLYYHEDTTLASIYINPEILDPSLRELARIGTPFVCHLDEKERQEALHIAREICGQTPQMPYTRPYCAALVTQLLVNLARANRIKENPLPPLIKAASAFAEAHYLENIALTDAADALSVSPNHLSARFRRVTGVSFTEYVMGLRMKQACHLLAATDMPIRDIAADCGFSSAEYFHAVFKKYTAMTPAAYRGAVGG